MTKQFDIVAWAKKVEAAREEKNVLVKLLHRYGAKTCPEDSPEIGALPYIVEFSFEDDVVVTLFIMLMDWQTDSDVVITNMTTLPTDKQNKGFGKKAINCFLQWARNNHLRDVRATQVSKDNEGFWLKNGFLKCKEPNPCNDFILLLTH